VPFSDAEHLHFLPHLLWFSPRAVAFSNSEWKIFGYGDEHSQYRCLSRYFSATVIECDTVVMLMYGVSQKMYTHV
jgi:hypothetical protein